MVWHKDTYTETLLTLNFLHLNYTLKARSNISYNIYKCKYRVVPPHPPPFFLLVFWFLVFVFFSSRTYSTALGGGSGVRAVLKGQRLLSLKCVDRPTLAPDELWRQLYTQTKRGGHTQRIDEAHNNLQSHFQLRV